ncbi:DUF2530 domain-containing protein [Cryptosporangium sp. NPDC051539]|uniref:DUF2530 domain-containing protein n=1 Tax=Cryptosporangium sp. NPDC051539 TaxID=3363962 RepID=UPI00379B5163
MARRPSRPTPRPLDVDAVSAVTIGTALWGVAALVLATVARGWLERHDDTWWIWTCVAGFLLGLLGTWLVRHRRSRILRAAEARAEQPASRPADPARPADAANSTHPADPVPPADPVASPAREEPAREEPAGT